MPSRRRALLAGTALGVVGLYAASVVAADAFGTLAAYRMPSFVPAPLTRRVPAVPGELSFVVLGAGPGSFAAGYLAPGRPRAGLYCGYLAFLATCLVSSVPVVLVVALLVLFVAGSAVAAGSPALALAVVGIAAAYLALFVGLLAALALFGAPLGALGSLARRWRESAGTEP